MYKRTYKVEVLRDWRGRYTIYHFMSAGNMA